MFLALTKLFSIPLILLKFKNEQLIRNTSEKITDEHKLYPLEKAIRVVGATHPRNYINFKILPPKLE